MTAPVPLSDLLAYRDGELLDLERSAEIEEDEASRQQLRRLRQLKHELNRLPEPVPDPALWERIQARHEAGARSGRFSLFANRSHAAAAPSGIRYPMATAAAVFLAAALGMLTWFPRESVVGGFERAEGTGTLVNRSQALESAVQFGPPAVGSFRVSTSEQALLYRIADVDAQLEVLLASDAPDQQRERALWQQRVELLENLVEVQRTQTAFPARPAIF